MVNPPKSSLLQVELLFLVGFRILDRVYGGCVGSEQVQVKFQRETFWRVLRLLLMKSHELVFELQVYFLAEELEYLQLSEGLEDFLIMLVLSDAKYDAEEANQHFVFSFFEHSGKRAVYFEEGKVTGSEVVAFNFPRAVLDQTLNEGNHSKSLLTSFPSKDLLHPVLQYESCHSLVAFEEIFLLDFENFAEERKEV